MLKIEDVIPFLKEYCNNNSIDYDKAYDQLCFASDDCATLLVINPDAPKADGLKNDIETQMLPTLYIRKNEDGFYAEETEYTNQFLIKSNEH